MRRPSLLFGAVLALGSAVGCAGPRVHYAYQPPAPPSAPPPPPSPLSPPPPVPAWCESGPATYYADFFTGRRTANGERYDPRRFTAAHKALPFGTSLIVSRMGRSVRVRVNDRGPYAHGAIIDLSRAAAESLGLLRAGRAQVTICRG